MLVMVPLDEDFFALHSAVAYTKVDDIPGGHRTIGTYIYHVVVPLGRPCCARRVLASVIFHKFWECAAFTFGT